MNNIRDQFKNEFQSETLKGDSFYIDDAAERPLGLIPYGEPVQTVIEEELGNTVEGESVVVADGDVEKEVKATVNGNSYQETTEGYNIYNCVEKLQTNPSGLTVEYDDKTGYITINGTPTKAYTGICSSMNITNILEDGETYTLKQEQYASANGGAYVQIVATDLTGKDNHLVASSAPRQIKIDKSNYIRYSIMVQTGPSLDAFNNYRNRYWLYKGTDDKPFEIFTNGVATPNPNHKQDIEVIEAYNKIDNNSFSNNYNVESIENGEIKSVSATTQLFIRFFVNRQVLRAGKTYTVKVKAKTSIPLSYAKMAGISLYNYGGNDTTRKQVTISKNPYITTEYQEYTGTVTLDEDFDMDRIYVQISKGDENEARNLYIKEVSLYEGTGDKPYLPYGHIGLVQRGKNYFNKDNANVVGGLFSDTTSGFTTGVSNNRSLYLKIKPNRTYTVSKILSRFALGTSPYAPSLTEKVAPTNYVRNDKVESLSITSGKNDEYLWLWFWNESDTNDYQAILDSIQIEDGIVKTKYEPYIEPKTIPINLAGNKLAKTNDTIRDLLNIGLNGNVRIAGNTITEKITSSNNIVKNEYGTNSYKIMTSKKHKKAESEFLPEIIVISNYFKGVSYTSRATDLNAIIYAEYNDAGKVTVRNTPFTTLEEFKTFLDNNDVYVTYALLTPETIDLPSIKPIELFEGTNVFELVTNLGTTMAVTYNYVTPSPSIDRPSEIFTVQGNYETEKVNENLLPNELKNETKNGITQTVYADGSINYKGVSTGTATFYIMRKRKNFLKDGIKYTLSSKNNMPKNVFFRLNDGDDSNKFYQISGNENIPNKITFINEKIGEYIVCYIYFGSSQIGSTFDFTIYPKLEVGSTATPYTPHQSTTLPLTVGNELLGEIVTLTEEEAKQLNLDGAGKYIRTDYGRYVFTGDEFFLKSSATQNTMFQFLALNTLIKKATSTNKIVKVFSNYFFGNYSADDIFAKDIEGIAVNNSGNINIGLGLNSEITTVDELKALFKEKYESGNAIEFIYPLATPTYEKITDETVLAQLKEYDKQIAFFGVNNINTYLVDALNKGPLKLEVTYDKSNRMKGE